MGKRVRAYCNNCGEPTTHECRVVDGEETYVCLCCESGKSRSKEEIERIKKQRKGWAVRPD